MAYRFLIYLSVLIIFVKCHPSTNQHYYSNVLPSEESDKFHIFESEILETKLREKRQDDNNSTSEEGPSITDLEDSFGGDAHSSDVKQDAPTTPKTGFYFLLDWNSFLELDNMEDGDKRKRISLQFRPKAGDPSRFLPVTVP
ncbi:hypothetical protein Trydic_g7132 [Trypoxylus dichotomus]